MQILYVSDMLVKQYSEIGLYDHAEAHLQVARCSFPLPNAM